MHSDQTETDSALRSGDKLPSRAGCTEPLFTDSATHTTSKSIDTMSPCWSRHQNGNWQQI